MKISKNSITTDLEKCNVVEKFFLKKIYSNVLKKIKQENFNKIFDFGSGHRNLNIRIMIRLEIKKKFLRLLINCNPIHFSYR